MAADVAQCGSSRIKSYASAFSNILIGIKMPNKNVTKEVCKSARRQACYEIKTGHELADILALSLFCEQFQRVLL